MDNIHKSTIKEADKRKQAVLKEKEIEILENAENFFDTSESSENNVDYEEDLFVCYEHLVDFDSSSSTFEVQKVGEFVVEEEEEIQTEKFLCNNFRALSKHDKPEFDENCLLLGDSLLLFFGEKINKTFLKWIYKNILFHNEKLLSRKAFDLFVHMLTCQEKLDLLFHKPLSLLSTQFIECRSRKYELSWLPTFDIFVSSLKCFRFELEANEGLSNISSQKNQPPNFLISQFPFHNFSLFLKLFTIILQLKFAPFLCFNFSST